MRKVKKIFVLTVAFAITVFTFTLGCKNGSTEEKSPQLQSLNNQNDNIRDTVNSTETGADSVLSSNVNRVNLPKMLELGSIGCRPCDMMTPILAELRKDYAGRLSIEFYDVRKDPKPAQTYKIRLIPTQIFLDANGKEFFRHEGFFPKEEIIKVLMQAGIE